MDVSRTTCLRQLRPGEERAAGNAVGRADVEAAVSGAVDEVADGARAHLARGVGLADGHGLVGQGVRAVVAQPLPQYVSQMQSEDDRGEKA